MSNVPVTIVADGGELRSGLPEALERIGAVIEVASLPAADYLVADRVGVERKTVPDLHRSIAGGRLWSQLLSCRQTLRRTFLLVEGSTLDEGPISRAGIRGALLEIGDRGVTVLRSADADDSAAWLLRLAVRAQRSRPAGGSRARRFRRAASPHALLAEIPGIGPKTASALLDEFGSVRGVATADVRDLVTVPGVGPKRAEELSRIFVES
jgi:DNA excision repair protein ERCC-4